MTILANALFGALVLLAVYHLFWGWTMLLILRRPPRPGFAEYAWPKTAILMSLRGADPSLANGIRSLLTQDYPDYEIFVAIDSETDPAWQVVREAIAQTGAANIRCETLKQPLPTCSLKCSALVQLSTNLDNSHQAIVLADSDFDCHRTWLRELVAPLADEDVGLTFGNRLFLPTKNRFGSVVRQVWNSPCLVTMAQLGLPWGGSMAVRGSVFRDSNLRDRWSRAICDDQVARIATLEMRRKVVFVPSLIMACREECSLTFFSNFVTRQLIWTRLFTGKWWWGLMFYSLTIFCLPMAAIVSSIAAAVGGELRQSVWLMIGLMLFSAGMWGCWLLIEIGCRLKVRQQGKFAAPLWSLATWKIPPAMLVASLLHLVALFEATFRRVVTWRGIGYEIRGPEDVRMLAHLPFDESRAENRHSSI